MPVLQSFSLAGKVAIVTGASSGLGVTLAIGLAEAGADLALAARRAEMLNATSAAVAATRRLAMTVATDVAQPDQCGQLVEATMERFGRLDILVNNAGTAYSIPATKDVPGEFERVLGVNLTACYWMAHHCARVMGPGSSIINISSVHGITRSDLPTAAYAASKAGLLGLTRDLAGQWSERRGIRVNAVAPGYFRTPMMSAAEDAESGFGQDVVRRRSLLKRLGEPQELVGPAVFLASDASAYVTGATLVVDGGLTA